MQMMNKDGKIFFVAASEAQTPNINFYERWEEAFRVYAGIFAQANPKRASELFQHMANIREAANIFSWESVYAYDKQFREIMGFFPQRNWGIIYNHGWMMMLKSPAQKVRNLNFKKRFRNLVGSLTVAGVITNPVDLNINV